MQTVLWGADDDVIVLDTTHFPVVLSTWFGRASAESIRPFYAALDTALERARREGKLLVNVVDSAQAEVPTAEVRRLISELTDAWEKKGAGPDTVKAFVVVENAAIRGVLQVLSWMHPSGGMKSVNVPSLAAAVTAAIEAMRERGIEPPPTFTVGRITRPTRPRH
ncbi:MAG: hypothetical protein J0L92_36860 [Deltaproteobacteria bacterium]|nr:hypothetical protein [Deltaproteobacteria bacterium]